MLDGLKTASYADQIRTDLADWTGAFMPATEFILQSLLLILAALGFLAVGLRTFFADKNHYEVVSRRTKSARNAATGVVGHSRSEESDAMVVHGMAVKKSGGKRVIVRNGKIARDSVASC